MTRPPEDDVAWGYFLPQHRNSVNAENFARSFFTPLNELARSLEDLLSALDLENASGERLDLIGSIVGASRYMPQGITLAYFGFAHQPAGRGFGRARMRHEGEPLTQSYTANDQEFKVLIRLKIMLNNGHGTAPEIAAAAKFAFRAPTASARDAGPGKIELWVGRIPSQDEGLGRVIPDMLPRLAGVSINIIFWEPLLPFGFANNGHFGFGVGVLARTPF